MTRAGHVVPGDDLLRGDFERDRAKADADHAIDRGHQKDQPGPALTRHAAETEDDAALVLAQHAHRRAGDHERGHGQEDEDDPECEDHAISSHSSARRTDSVRPLTRSTTTESPS